jgi:acyl-CoA synthetase (AMP-forming)/AMP-acid ligase II
MSSFIVPELAENFMHQKILQFGQTKPDQNAVNFLNENTDIANSYNFGELANGSRAIAFHIKEVLKLNAGDRLLLVYPPGSDFLFAFFACLMVGVIAVPVYPPDPSKIRKDGHTFNLIRENCGSAYALTSNLFSSFLKYNDIKQFFIGGNNSLKELQWVVTDKMISDRNSPMLPLEDVFQPHSDDVAYLQYTSGSTSVPKGVMVSFGNLRACIMNSLESFEWDGITLEAFSWLPQYHDLGLLMLLIPLSVGHTIFFMSPFDFIRNPLIWIDGLSRYKITNSAAPNFAYALSVRKFNEILKSKTSCSCHSNWATHYKSTLNLSTLRSFVNSAEPVMKSTVELFENTFAAYGLPSNVVGPYYGLAEHVLYVAGPNRLHTSVIVDKGILET